MDYIPGITIGYIKGRTRSLDYSSYGEPQYDGRMENQNGATGATLQPQLWIIGYSGPEEVAPIPGAHKL